MLPQIDPITSSLSTPDGLIKGSVNYFKTLLPTIRSPLLQNIVYSFLLCRAERLQFFHHWRSISMEQDESSGLIEVSWSDRSSWWAITQINVNSSLAPSLAGLAMVRLLCLTHTLPMELFSVSYWPTGSLLLIKYKIGHFCK